MPTATLRKDGCADLIPPSRLAPRPLDARPALVVLAPTHRGTAPFDARPDALAGLERLEQIAQRHGIVPTYAVDHALAADGRRCEPLVALAARGRASLAAHLVPALTPPLDGAPPAPQPGNLERALERQKLDALLAAIEARAGVRPKVYVAAAGGIGKSSPALLVDAGIEVDASARPGFDLTRDGGPDFRGFPAGPFFYPGVSGLLAVPQTGARVTPFGGRLAALDPLGRALGLDVARGLDVEQASASGLARLVDAVRSRGVRVFSLTARVDAFAGPAGEQLARRLDAFLATFLGRLGGRATTHAELHAELARKPEREGPYAPR